MAATRLIPLHVNKGKSAAKSMQDRLDYAQNLEKTEHGELIEAYECDPRLAWQEFMLDRNNYLNRHSRDQRSDVLAYQIRQSFKPGEVSPENANRIGYELAMRFTKGKHAFTVSTHTDRAHVHNHIIFNAVSLDGDRKFRNFFLSAYALRKLSDIICLEHGLSIIEDHPRQEWQRKTSYKKEQSLRDILRFDLEDILDRKPKSLEELIGALADLGYEVKRGKYLAVKPAKASRFIRLKSLGDGYTEEALIAIIMQPVKHRSNENTSGESISLIKKMETVIREKKGPAYENWVKDFNVKQGAKTLFFFQDNNIKNFKQMDDLIANATMRFHELSDKIKNCEARLSEIAELKKTIINYSKTRSVYEAYRKAGYSKKFYEEHRAEITIHRAAKKQFDALGTKKIPRVKELSEEYERILADKKEAYKEYRVARSEMQKYSIAKKNMEILLERESVPERNAQPSHEVG